MNWKVLERWLSKKVGVPFTNRGLARALKIEPWQASQLIGVYLAQQRRKGSPTAYVLHREGRTRAAVWTAGDRKLDLNMIRKGTFEDIQVKLRRTFEPDLNTLGQINPALAKQCGDAIDGVLNGAMKVLEVALLS